VVKKKRKGTAEKNELREELLRPSRHLGYDRDILGLHLMRREAYLIAESQFRRAIWLNPFEPLFKAHLAVCLYELHHYSEAKDWAGKALEQDSQNEIAFRIIHFVEQMEIKKDLKTKSN
jgi:tetratricopeptide (TPR) repeat protein